MKRLLSIFLVFAFNSLFAQDSMLKIKPALTIKGEVRDFTTDNMGNIYVVTNTNQVKKLSSKGDSISIYNDIRRYGKIYSIDATNPLKVLVYFRDFGTIVVLDRLLNARNTIDLRRENILQVRAVTSSYDNNIWLYDELESKIKKIDDNGRVIFESTDYRQAFDSVPTPVSMFDRDGQLYLYDQRKGIFVFDYYGARKNTFQLFNYSDLQVLNKNSISAKDSSSIILYNPLALQLDRYTIPNYTNYSKINFNGNRVYGLTKEGNLEVLDIIL